jgi:tyrosyl-DNA phosphodiesterase-1
MKTSQGHYSKKPRLRPLTTYTRAIALSLQEAKRKPQAGVIELDSDDDEEAQFQKDLKHALQQSTAETSQSGSHPAIASSSSQPPEPPGQSTTNAFLSERAQLEKARRERQKRLRPSTSRKSTEDEESDDEEPPAKRHQVSTSSSSRLRSNVSSSSKILGSTSTPTIEQIFWNGELRQTATQHAEPRKDGRLVFRLTEVLGKVCLLS